MEPSQKAVDLLLQNPELAPQFDQKFGIGASSSHLQGLSEVPEEEAQADVAATVEADEGVLNSLGETLEPALDTARGIVNGVSGFGQSVVDLSADVLNAADSGVEAVTGVRVAELVDGEGARFGGLELPRVEEAEDIVGRASQGITQFGLGFVTGTRLLQTAGVTINTIGGSAAAGAVGDFIAFDEHEARLSNLVQEVPALENPITEYLSADPNDSWAEGRLKNVLEGMGIGALMSGALLSATKTYRLAKSLSHEGNEAAAKEALEQGSKEIDGLLKEASEDGADVAVRQADEADELLDSAAPRGGPETPEEALAARDVPQRLDDSQVTEIAQRIERGDGDLEAVSESFNIKKWDTPEQGKEAINELVERLRQTDPETFGGVQSQDTVAQLANEMGADPEVFWKALADAAESSEQLPAILYRAHAENAAVGAQLPGIYSEFLAMKAAGNEPAAQELFDRVLVSMNVYAERWVQTKALQKGMARGTAIGNAVKELRDAVFGKTGTHGEDAMQLFSDYVTGTYKGSPEQFAQRMASLKGNRSAVMRMLDWVLSNKTWDVANEIFINNILSGVKTHVVNMTSTAVETSLVPLERAAGSVLRGDITAARADLSAYMGMVHGLRDSMEMSFKSLLQERNFLDPAHAVNELNARHVITAQNLLPEGEKNLLAKPVNLVGKGLRLPSRFLAAEDEFFKQINYRARVYRDAYEQALNSGASGKQAAGAARKRVNAAFDEKGVPTNEKALEYAREATFTNDLEYGAGKHIQNLVNRAPLFRTVLPFVRTPTNLYRNVIRRTPMAFLDARSARSLVGLEGVEAQSDAWAKMFMGSSVAGFASYLAAEGMITGAAPRTREGREQKISPATPGEGWQPYSFFIGGKYYSFDRGDPRFAIFGIVADANRIMNELPEHKQDELGMIISMSMVNNLASKSYLKGLHDTMNAVTSGDPKAFQRWYQSVIVARTLPFNSLLNQVNPDRELKEVRGLTDSFLSKVPGFSDQVEPKRDILGRITYRPQDHYVSPVSTSEASQDPLTIQLAALNSELGRPTERIPGTRIDLTQYTAGNKPGAQSAFDRWQELTGTVRRGRFTLEERLRKEVEKFDNNPQKFPELDGPDVSFIRSRRAERMSDIISQYRAKAMRKLMSEAAFSHLKSDYDTERDNKRRVKRQGPEALQDLVGQ